MFKIKTLALRPRSLTTKLILSFLLVSIAGAVLAAGLVRWMSIQEFSELVLDQAQNRFITEISIYYQTEGSWQGVFNYLRFRDSVPEPPHPLIQRPLPIPPDKKPGTAYIFALADQGGVVVVPAGDYRMREKVSDADLVMGTVITIDGIDVGTVIATGNPPPLDPREINYLQRTNQALLYSVIGAAVLAIFLGVFLARMLTRPLGALQAAFHEIGQGAIKHQLPVRSGDEFGQLTVVFNQMSADLAHANDLRRQMTADIAHELRTPLTVLGGYIEAMREGTLSPTVERFETIHAEVQHLVRLVEDLHTLSLADAGELQINRVAIAPQDLLARVVNLYQYRADQQDVLLLADVSGALPKIYVDPDRIVQVLGNIIFNALCYTLAKDTIRIQCVLQDPLSIVITVTDTGTGIAAEKLQYIFERFYRADDSRQGSASGLGLAIAKSIVDAHGGTILVTSQLGQGTKFTISLPTV
ncbi:MAG: HAMP domain-containing histidine kinase [Chloroflexi bacterium]|nr:HAMP domain-containing histidine kinase [Chloroflexota bacterium]